MKKKILKKYLLGTGIIASTIIASSILVSCKKEVNKTTEELKQDLAKIVKNEKLMESIAIEKDGTFVFNDLESPEMGRKPQEHIDFGKLINSIEMKRILEKTKKIGDYVFYSSLSKIEEINLPECTSIGKYAFSHNDSLTKIDLPKCESIGEGAFAFNKKINKINLPECTLIGEGAFFLNKELTTINLPKCTEIKNFVFALNESLISINLPKCTSIGDSAFFSNTLISNLNLPECISIETNAFNKNTSISNLNLPKCTSIGEGAFKSIPENQIITWDLTTLKIAYTNDQTIIGDNNSEIERIIQIDN